jgi:hypothetical protein
MKEDKILNYLVMELKRTPKEVQRLGIELLLLEDLDSIRLLRRRLNDRLKTPISRSYLSELKIMYYMLGNYITEVEDIEDTAPIDILDFIKSYDNPLSIDVQPPNDLLMSNSTTYRARLPKNTK